MSNGYFNYTTFRPDGYWSRRSFVRAWWRLNARDRRWVPPDFPTFVRHVEHGANDPDLRHLRSQPIYMEALPRRSTGGGNDAHVGGLGAVFEEPVAATIVQVDAQPQACTAYLSFLHCANDEETMERLLGKVMEHAAMANCTQFIGPTGPIPQWNSGALQNFFQLTPPMHTPYDPPYVPDLLASMMEPFYTTTLYHVPVPAVLPTAPAPARIVPLALDTLASDLMDLLDEALAHHDVYSKLDESAIAVLVRWLGAFPVHGWVAYLDDVPVGFVAVQARSFRPGPQIRWRAPMAPAAPVGLAETEQPRPGRSSSARGGGFALAGPGYWAPVVAPRGRVCTGDWLGNTDLWTRRGADGGG